MKTGAMRSIERRIAIRNRAVLAVVLAIGLSLISAQAQKMKTDIPPTITTPDSVETRLGTLKFTDGYPDDATTQKVYDNLDFINGVNAFLNAMPGASVEAIKAGFASQGADNNQTVLIMEGLMDSKSLFLTPNADTVYSMMWLDTKDGPLVLETPPNVLGVLMILVPTWLISAGSVLTRARAVSSFCSLPATRVRCLTATLSCVPGPTAMCASGADSWRTAARRPLWTTLKNSPRSIGWPTRGTRRR